MITGKSGDLNLIENPFPDQTRRINPLGFCNLLHCFNLFGLQVNPHSYALKDWFGDLFQLVFEISGVVRVPEPSQFFNRVSLGDLSAALSVFPLVVSPAIQV